MISRGVDIMFVNPVDADGFLAALEESNSEIGEILGNDTAIESDLKILQREVNNYLQQ